VVVEVVVVVVLELVGCWVVVVIGVSVGASTLAVVKTVIVVVGDSYDGVIWASCFVVICFDFDETIVDAIVDSDFEVNFSVRKSFVDWNF